MDGCAVWMAEWLRSMDGRVAAQYGWQSGCAVISHNIRGSNQSFTAFKLDVQRLRSPVENKLNISLVVPLKKFNVAFSLLSDEQDASFSQTTSLSVD